MKTKDINELEDQLLRDKIGAFRPSIPDNFSPSAVFSRIEAAERAWALRAQRSRSVWIVLVSVAGGLVGLTVLFGVLMWFYPDLVTTFREVKVAYSNFFESYVLMIRKIVVSPLMLLGVMFGLLLGLDALLRNRRKLKARNF